MEDEEDRIGRAGHEILDEALNDAGHDLDEDLDEDLDKVSWLPRPSRSCRISRRSLSELFVAWAQVDDIGLLFSRPASDSCVDSV
jgi:hypothetical protein